MTQEELELKERLEVNRLEMGTQEWLLSETLEKLYEQGLYKEYIEILRITKAIVYITERRKNIQHELEQVRKNKKV